MEPTTRLRHADIAALWTTGENRQTKRMIDQRPKNREKLKERERLDRATVSQGKANGGGAYTIQEAQIQGRTRRSRKDPSVGYAPCRCLSATMVDNQCHGKRRPHLRKVEANMVDRFYYGIIGCSSLVLPRPLNPNLPLSDDAAILLLLVLLVRKRAEANVAVCLSQVRNRLNYFGY